ncbi:UNKNOWN [Stylonychia lemnae]|uniref:Uncharacterized protein n=1 Tax=Stylonychia lemnae TaxID=5949 RepID=A0A078A352_STYLE|nr:UNKNOWN [Stylonychia lemnae]|eukprot:CDW75194.1 UNKNOWN [Stylonychia lemnae]
MKSQQPCKGGVFFSQKKKKSVALNRTDLEDSLNLVIHRNPNSKRQATHEVIDVKKRQFIEHWQIHKYIVQQQPKLNDRGTIWLLKIQSLNDLEQPWISGQHQ